MYHRHIVFYVFSITRCKVHEVLARFRVRQYCLHETTRLLDAFKSRAYNCILIKN